MEVCGFAQAQFTVESLTTVPFVVPAGTEATKLPVMSLLPPSAWDTESYYPQLPSRDVILTLPPTGKLMDTLFPSLRKISIVAESSFHE